MRKLLLAASLAVLASVSPGHAAKIALAPFYQNLAAISPDQPLGTVVAKEPVATEVPGAEAWRIAYVSSDVRGKKTLSTGLVVVPKGAPPAGGRPIVAWAHGTTGTAQYCGPSQVLDPVQELNEYFLVGGTSWTDFGIPAVTHFIEKGYAVVATDYQGLGGGGDHQYGVANSNAHDAINSVRALGSMGLAGDGKKALIYGWSQGGGTTIAAASLKDYISETGTAYDGVSFVGFVALAPDDLASMITPDATTDEGALKFMQGFASTFSDNVFNFAHFSMYTWGMVSAYPELKLTDLFTEDGAKALDEIYSKKCMHPGSDTINFTFGASYKSLVKPQPENTSAWTKALIDSSVQKVAPIAPVLIYFGTADTVVPPVMGEIYQKQMCGMGGNVTRVQLEGAQNHFTTPPTAEPLYIPWVDDRLAGKPLDNGCPAN
ncbi:lipase [Aestuariivirga litoralis]|uniref:Lipase n=1 Tax=Aestuariivirga litoralis TaxID=2650924 RepID=A0A2W2ASS1_9HYPH|nr:alpha/beta fold hydrolase [Aestuariivirga litoralis]PZF75570.1 lipase [Aestuariivirga litoralis]